MADRHILNNTYRIYRIYLIGTWVQPALSRWLWELLLKHISRQLDYFWISAFSRAKSRRHSCRPDGQRTKNRIKFMLNCFNWLIHVVWRLSILYRKHKIQFTLFHWLIFIHAVNPNQHANNISTLAILTAHLIFHYIHISWPHSTIERINKINMI